MNKDDTARRLRETVVDLAVEIGPRAPGGPAEQRAAEYVVSELSAMELEAQVVSFPSPSHRAVRARLALVGGAREFPCLPGLFSVCGEARGELIFIGDLENSPFRPNSLSGKIGLILPGGGNHRESLEVLSTFEKKGLLGLIVVSPTSVAVGTELLRSPKIGIPVASVSFETGVELKRKDGREVILAVDGPQTGTNESRNVVAFIEGKTDNWLVLDAHIDTAPVCPGAGDNASGVAVVLELARRLRESRPAARVVLLLSGSQEYGADDGFGRGALSFYENPIYSLASCLGHIDVDTVGTPLGRPVLFLSGPRPFRRACLTASIAGNYRVKGQSGRGCGHGAAEANGIPCAWFTDLVDGCFPMAAFWS